MNQEFAKLERFNGQHYTHLADNVKFVLHVLKLAYVLDPKLAPIPDDPFPETGKNVDPTIISDLEKESQELYVGRIKNSLSDRLYDIYVPVKDLRELWSTLELKYKSHEEGTNKYLVSKYLEFQMADDKPIMEQVMVNKLNVLSISIPELFQVGAIIAKLPPSRKDFSKRMIHKYEDYSLDDLKKYRRIKEDTCIRDKRVKVGSSVNHVSVGGSGHKTKFGGQNKRNLGPKKQSFKKLRPCHICGELMHYAIECKDHKLGPVSHAVDQMTDMVASVNLGEIFMITSLTRAICARGWSVETGSIMYVCGQRERFHTYHLMPPGTIVVCVDGHIAEVQGRGDVRQKFTCDVLHVPTIWKGLVSADKFDKGGFKMELEKGRIVITKGRRYVGRGNNCLRMYCLCLDDEGSTSGYSVDSNGESVASVSSVTNNDVIDGLVANMKLFMHLNCIRLKSKIYLKDTSKFFARTEAENTSTKSFDTFCEENGIKHERTSSYTPQHNGLAERKNRTLCEMGCCSTPNAPRSSATVLNQSGQPNNLWGEALLTACYVHNRITSRVILTSPYELWKARKPNIDYLKVWGYVAYYRTPDPKRTKLGAQANKSVVVDPKMWNSLRTSFLGMMKTLVIQHLQVLLEKYSHLLLLWRNQGEVLGLE
uniref:Integrase catalytic domain-containing protein n=1 Tax=Lactuca sativa TaxID=4236 RepID=A0A9R1UY00_LACSA|nr:hypothetical protein LSAT_V11C700357350 [Lactuca sativa]